MAKEITPQSLIDELDQASALALESGQPAAIAAISRARLAILEQQQQIRESQSYNDMRGVSESAFLDRMSEDMSWEFVQEIADALKKRQQKQRKKRTADGPSAKPRR